jgi:hypothetical protein
MRSMVTRRAAQAQPGQAENANDCEDLAIVFHKRQRHERHVWTLMRLKSKHTAKVRWRMQPSLKCSTRAGLVIAASLHAVAPAYRKCTPHTAAFATDAITDWDFCRISGSAPFRNISRENGAPLEQRSRRRIARGGSRGQKK